MKITGFTVFVVLSYWRLESRQDVYLIGSAVFVIALHVFSTIILALWPVINFSGSSWVHFPGYRLIFLRNIFPMHFHNYV